MSNTSVVNKDVFAVELNNEDFITGNLQQKSDIRPNKLFTADKKTFLSHGAKISSVKFLEVINAIIKLIETDY